VEIFAKMGKISLVITFVSKKKVAEMVYADFEKLSQF